MKNIQVIDGADNCAYDVFAATEREFILMFPDGRDVEFVDDLVDRMGEKTADHLLKALWNRPRDKKKIEGIHGTLFFELGFKKKYYPTKKESEMVANP